MRRQVHEAIALDQSLRQSRAIWLSLAVFCLPLALGGFGSFVVSCIEFGNPGQYGYVSPTGLLARLAFAGIVIALDIVLFRRVAEATRRIKKLKEDPSANVRHLPAPFQASLFGPYH